MKTDMLRALFSPLAYLRIRHPSKTAADWTYPLLAAAVSALVLYALGGATWFAAAGGLLDKLLVFAAVLPGFFIAALAAIATFNRPGIDELMPSPAPRLWVVIGGKDNDIELTRRRFLAHLFSFLCWESILLMLVCVFGALASKGVVQLIGADWASYVRPGAAFVVLLILWQIVSTTCLGLFYLGERLNQPTS